MADPSDGPGIGINGFLTFTLKFESSQVTLIEFFESICFCRLHNVYSFFVNARNWTDTRKYTLFLFFPPRSGFVQ